MKWGCLALPLSLALLPACSDSSTEFWLSPNNLFPIVALDNRVAYVEKTSATAFVLDPADPSLRPKLAPVGVRPITAVKHVGSNRLLVVSAGKHGSASVAPVPAEITVIDPAALDAQPPPSDRASIALSGRFDGLAQSPDGQFAVLYHTSSTQGADDVGLFNPNELVVLDFSANLAGMPIATVKPIRSMGGVPSTSNPSVSPIQFSPIYGFAAGPRRLAVVLSQNYVTIFDLDLNHLDRSEISVPLCPATGTCNYAAEQIVFDPANLSLYVRAAGAKDIFQISLTDLGTAGVSPGGNDFRASISMLAVGASATDMALYGAGVDTRLAVVAADAKRLVILDPKTGHSAAVAVPIVASHIVPFTAPSQDPANPLPSNRALLVDLQRNGTSVLFVDLDKVEEAGDSSFDQRSIPGTVGLVRPLLNQGVVILMFARSSSNAVLSVVTLAEKPSFFDFNSASVLSSPFLEVRNPGQLGESTRLWSVDSPEGGLPSPNSGIRFQELVPASGQRPVTVWLDQTISSITPLALPSADGHRYLVLEHLGVDTYGDLTFVDADNPDRSTARTARGFLFTDYLGRPQP
jgi:hypothetical protein